MRIHAADFRERYVNYNQGTRHYPYQGAEPRHNQKVNNGLGPYPPPENGLSKRKQVDVINFADLEVKVRWSRLCVFPMSYFL